MKKSKRLQPIVDLAKGNERNKMQDLSATQLKLSDARGKLEEMKSYRLEYQRNIQQVGQKGISAERWRQANAFLNQLEQLIKQQGQIILNAEKNVDISREQWIQAHNRYRSLHKAMDKFAVQEGRAENIKEQKEMDDLAGARHARGGKDKDIGNN